MSMYNIFQHFVSVPRVPVHQDRTVLNSLSVMQKRPIQCLKYTVPDGLIRVQTLNNRCSSELILRLNNAYHEAQIAAVFVFSYNANYPRDF